MINFDTFENLNCSFRGKVKPKSIKIWLYSIMKLK